MKFGSIPLDQSVGKILGHNISSPDGKRALSKGKILTSEDIDILNEIGRNNIYVAELDADDINENSAAQKMSSASIGVGIKLTRPNVGGTAVIHRCLRRRWRARNGPATGLSGLTPCLGEKTTNL